MNPERFEEPSEVSEQPYTIRPWKEDEEKLVELIDNSDRSKSEIMRDVIHRGLKVVYQEWKEVNNSESF